MTTSAHVTHSVSTWQQVIPETISDVRLAAISAVEQHALGVSDWPLRIAIDGFSASGKTTFGHELAQTLASSGRPIFRVSLDDFKRPWSEAHLYDRLTGEGYFRNAFDYDALRRLLIEPTTSGAGEVALCSIDPLTQLDHSDVQVHIPANGIVIVDGVFALRQSLRGYWHVSVWLDISPELSVTRGTTRDSELEGGDEEAEALHRSRYLPSELLHLSESSPVDHADFVIDNTTFDGPRIIRQPHPRANPA